jgi:hypothetical protein
MCDARYPPWFSVFYMRKNLPWLGLFALCFWVLLPKLYAQEVIELSEVQVIAPAFYLKDKSYEDSVEKKALGLADVGT